MIQPSGHFLNLFVTMVTLVMTSSNIGLTEDDLKPAFLMLSSCYNELSKRSQKDGGTSSDTYQKMAAESLQKVYGTNLPIPGGSIPTAPRHGCLADTGNLPKQPKFVQSTSSEDLSRLDKMQREVQSLRDRHTHHSACLSQLRSSKRNLEEDLSEERYCRRKVERELQHASQELTSARRVARSTAEQCRREAESRRRAEERAIELRDEVMVIKKELDILGRDAGDKERKTKECFGKLGVLFLKAAKGEIRLDAELLEDFGEGNSLRSDHRRLSTASSRGSVGGF